MISDSLEFFKAAKNVLDKSVDYISNKYQIHEIKKIKNEYLEYCKSFLLIKTLNSPEEDVFINDIFVPVIIKRNNDVSIKVEDRTNLEIPEKAILIKGLAGMGKSTILRKLLANNLEFINRIPIFYELKRYKGGAIENSLSKDFGRHGINITADQIETLLDESNLKLYLDAFDEVEPKYRNELLGEIDRIIRRYNCHLVCTTRPDTDIDSLTGFATFHVASLKEEQIFGIINKTVVNQEKAQRLCEALANSRLHNSSETILKTPILVVLYCISYNQGDEIPTTLSQFYENIFETVFFKHDNLKGAVHRPRVWNDNRRIYRLLFEYFCYISQRQSITDFTRSDLVELVVDSLEYLGEDAKKADAITDDLISITNLIIPDGYNEYRFVHKSIQEFFSAAFISGLSSDKKQQFYEACIKKHDLNSLFKNTLFFLEEIDYYDYMECFFIPGVSSLLNLDVDAKLSEDYKVSDLLLDKFLIVIDLLASIKTIKNQTLKKNVLEKKVLPPVIHVSLCDSIFEVELFSFVLDMFDFGKYEAQIIKTIVEFGREREKGVFYLDLKRFSDLVDLESDMLEKFREALFIGVGVLYDKKYNRVLHKTQNRKFQIEKQGYLSF